MSTPNDRGRLHLALLFGAQQGSPASRTLGAADHPRPLAEDSPTDYVWGARDPHAGHGGQNLLGLALMRVRGELIADVRTRLAALAPAR